MSKIRELLDQLLTPSLPDAGEMTIEEAILLEHQQDFIAVHGLLEEHSLDALAESLMSEQENKAGDEVGFDASAIQVGETRKDLGL